MKKSSKNNNDGISGSITNKLQSKESIITQIEELNEKKVAGIYQYDLFYEKLRADQEERTEYYYSTVHFSDGTVTTGRIQPDGTFVSEEIPDEGKILYKLENVTEAIKKNHPIYIVRSEESVKALQAIGLPATTAGKGVAWSKKYCESLIGAVVVILIPDDKENYTVAKEIQSSLGNYVQKTKIVKLPVAKGQSLEEAILSRKLKRKTILDAAKEVKWVYAPWIVVTEGKEKESLSVNTGKFVECLNEVYHFLIVASCENKQNALVYIYENGRYAQASSMRVMGILKKRLPVELRKTAIHKDVFEQLKTCIEHHVEFEAIDADEKIINLKNGLLNIKSMELRPHSPEVLSSIQYDCNYIPDAKPEKFMKFLEELCLKDGLVDWQKINQLQEWIGLIVSNLRGYRIKKALYLYSIVGNTGKSVFLRVLESIVGSSNCIDLSLQELSGKFVAADFYDKRMIICGDVGTGYIDTKVLKKILGGDSIRVEAKYAGGFDFRYRGCCTLIGNVLPHFSDDTGDHLYQRFEIMEFFNVIPPEKRDPMLDERLMEEKDEIFSWALEGLHRLISNNYRFTEVEDNKRIMDQLREKNDSVYAYIRDHCLITGNERKDRISKADFEENYRDYCLNEGYQIQKDIVFYAEKNGIRYKKSNGMIYAGVRYKEDSPYHHATQEKLPF